MKALDIFGNTLYTGDVVVFADVSAGEPELALYEIEAVEDTNVVLAIRQNGDWIGHGFYLQDTNTRCSLIRNVYKTAEAKLNSTVH